ncbi:MAG: EF-P beta-lysylation protein EpmB [Acidobacteriota bacterium]
MGDAVRSVDELLGLLGLEARDLDLDPASARSFALRVPRGFVALMRRGDPQDPLLLQVLPTARELDEVPGWIAEPLQESAFSPVEGLLHKYPGRALLVVTGACAVHCRYCFRRHFPYGEHVADLGPALGQLRADPSIREVLLSGGDPLSLTDAKLSRLVDELGAIPHVERLRIHTRLPVVLPERVDGALLDWLRASRLQKVVVLHANHPRELSPEVRRAALRLRDAGAIVLNQSVLLRGVNDDVAVLCDLSESLFAAGVMPYYLHLMDRVAGAAHFDVPEATARNLIRQLRGTVAGYLVPRLVREVPGAPSKTPVEV